MGILDSIIGRRPPRCSDAASCVIVSAAEVDAATLDEILGMEGNTVRNARARFRRVGWSCRVGCVACAHCGELHVPRGHRTGRAVYHSACRLASRREIQYTQVHLAHARGVRRRHHDRAGHHHGGRRLRLVRPLHLSDTGPTDLITALGAD